jgi:hypothetical protein
VFAVGELRDDCGIRYERLSKCKGPSGKRLHALKAPADVFRRRQNDDWPLERERGSTGKLDRACQLMQVWDEQAERYAGQSEISISTESVDAGMLGVMVLEARPILCGRRSDASALILSLSDSLRFLNNFTCMDRVCPSSCVASTHQRVLHRTHLVEVDQK